MATYSTDLSTLTTAESGTWYELTGTILGFTLSGAGSPSIDTENYIQGTNCYSQTTGKAVDAEISIVFDNGSGYSFSAGDVVFGWCFYAVGVNLKTKANSGWMFVICDSLTTGDYFVIGGSDSGRNPYGGWMNVAIDPTATESGTLGAGGNGGTYRYFGQVCNTLGEISKGTPSGVDAIRAGRGIISVTGSGGSFTELASYNDYNGGSTPPGSGSTSVDSGRHVLGLFQENGGVFLWKGLLSFGTSSTSVTFSDSNETIIIDDCPHTYASFNKIEVHNASSSVTLTNISFISTASTANGKGYFEMVDNATVTLNGCLFLSMGTFIFQSNGSINNCSFVGCGQITHGGADFESCSFQGYEGTSDTAYMTYAVAADPDGELDNCSFTKGTASTHAIEFDATNTPTTITLRGINFSGYNASNGNTDSTLYFPSTSKSYTVNLVGCSGNISYKVGSGGSVTLVSNPVTFLVTVKDIETGSVIQNARVFSPVTSGVNFPYLASVSIVSSGTTATVTHTGHGLATNDWVWIKGANEDAYNGSYQITVTGTDTYTYTMTESTSSPATGTITSTFVVLSGLTDINGQISDSRTYSSDQPVGGWGRKADSSPFFKSQPISDTIDNADGLSITLFLSRDE